MSEAPKPCPPTACVVSGEKLGAKMGAPHELTYSGREIRLCCKSCLSEFNQAPAKYIERLEAAEEKPDAHPNHLHPSEEGMSLPRHH